MRKYTLVFSIAAHASAIAAIIIVPALATEELPEPWRTSTFIVVRPVPPPPVQVRPRTNREAPNRNAAPIAPPEGIQPEPVVEPPLDTGAAIGNPLTGVPVGDAVANGDLIPPPPPPPRPKEPVRPGGVIQQPKKLVHVAPVYPPIALAAGKEGLVILEALIAEDGTVRDVRVLRSELLLDEAAVTAVRQWRFTPTLLNGEPVPVVMTVTVGFTLDR